MYSRLLRQVGKFPWLKTASMLTACAATHSATRTAKAECKIADKDQKKPLATSQKNLLNTGIFPANKTAPCFINNPVTSVNQEDKSLPYVRCSGVNNDNIVISFNTATSIDIIEKFYLELKDIGCAPQYTPRADDPEEIFRASYPFYCILAGKYSEARHQLIPNITISSAALDCLVSSNLPLKHLVVWEIKKPSEFVAERSLELELQNKTGYTA